MDLFAGGWRNGLLFDPLQQYGNYSYADVMLYPLAAALSQAADADTKIYMAMQVCNGCWKGLHTSVNASSLPKHGQGTETMDHCDIDSSCVSG